MAAAANLTEVFQSLGPQFEAQTGIRVQFSFGSTAQLARQIENSAPFDVFAAADAVHVRQLDQAGLLEPGTRAPYAKGVLALWIPPRSRVSISRFEDLDSPAVRVIAIAKPELAPYGQAAMEALQHVGILDRVRPKIVYAENISMAKQYGTSNNADAVLTAYSLVLHSGGRAIRVDQTLYRPIEQELGITAHTHNRQAAHQFVDFLLTGKGRDALIAYGYQSPGGRGL